MTESKICQIYDCSTPKAVLAHFKDGAQELARAQIRFRSATSLTVIYKLCSSNVQCIREQSGRSLCAR